MIGLIFLIIALLLSVITLVWTILLALKYRQRLKKSYLVLIGGIGIAAVILFFPVYGLDLRGLITALLVSVQHAVRLFLFDGGYMELREIVEGLVANIGDDIEFLKQIVVYGYGFATAVLYIVAPILTVSGVLSFFKNKLAEIRYRISGRKKVHVFSELNEKSLALAKSIFAEDNESGGGNALIVFTDVLDKDDETSLDLLEEAKEMGAILFSRDLASIKYCGKKSTRNLNFYLISDDEAEKIRHAESIIQTYDKPVVGDNVELRIISDDIRVELFMSARNVSHMKALRINDIQSLIYHNLDVNGLRLFKNARQIGSEKVISAVIVGLGKYGVEMLKALTWFCQMKDYRIKIQAFDIDEHAKEKFENMCPELMNEKFNGKDIPGEARYEIEIHGGIDTKSQSFSKKLAQINDATYIFVCLGSDEENLETATRIRALCEGVQYVDGGDKPDIETVIYDSNICETMGIVWNESKNEKGAENADQTKDDQKTGVVNFKNQAYNIHMIGDLDHFYSVNTLIDPDLVRRGEEINVRWAKENYPNHPEYMESDKKMFYKYEYNYRSSIAKAIHERLREKMHLEMGVDFPGIDMSREDLLKDPALCLEIGKIEHVRWNAYMRTEGYQYSALRNDLGKLHHNLVPVSELTDDDLRKDA